MITIPLGGSITSSYSGYKILIKFYNQCSLHKNTKINIDFSKLNWIDANLCSLLEAITHKLEQDNKLEFLSDVSFLEENFDVLLRNGFIRTGKKIVDNRESVVPLKQFDCNDDRGFCDYLEKHLMPHRGLKFLSKKLSERIMDDLIEVFCNSNHHAETTDPFFVAGQYYPGLGALKFTMVDLGNGFLPRIHKATDGQIKASLDAIKWALNGNSSKLVIDRTIGGLGIKGIHTYCKENKGCLDIISGDGYWSSEYNNLPYRDGRKLNDYQFVGTTINLTFKK